jgi:hypothetical protein
MNMASHPGPVRVAIGDFLHETNTCAPSPAGLDAFEQGGGWPGLCRGEDVLTRTRGVNVSIAGFVASAREQGWELSPTLWAAASPSGPVRRDAYETIVGELIHGIAQAGPLDGIYLDLHGLWWIRLKLPLQQLGETNFGEAPEELPARLREASPETEEVEQSVLGRDCPMWHMGLLWRGAGPAV